MAASQLDAQERIMIRSVHDEESEIPGDLDPSEKQTINDLVGKGYMRYLDGVAGLTPVLTRKGQIEYSRIMESGDGPEGLKEMFRF